MDCVVPDGYAKGGGTDNRESMRKEILSKAKTDLGLVESGQKKVTIIEKLIPCYSAF